MSEQIIEIPLTELLADETFNCRGKIAPIDVVDLAQSIEREGLIQPITITPLNPPVNGKKYKIIAGYRRYTAHRILDKETIKCIITEQLDERKARIINLTENLGRKDLNIVQEARAIVPLINLGMTQEEIAKELPGGSRGWVQVRVMLLDLPEAIIKEAESNFLTQSHIRDLYSMKTKGLTDDELGFMVQKIKKAKERGLSYNLGTEMKAAKPAKERKRKRVPSEIRHMIDHIIDAIKGNFGTRCLAWAAGEISDGELYDDIAVLATEKGLQYVRPE